MATIYSDRALILDSISKYPLELDDIILLTLFTVVISLWTSHAVLWQKPPKGQHLYYVAPQLQEEVFQTKSRGLAKQVTRNINDRMNELQKDIIVFWGSQSGTSERLANNLVRECTTRFNLPAMAANLDHFDYDQLGQLTTGRIVGFIVATYGEGGPTDNASGLDEYLNKVASAGKQSLSGLQYFCFGLGDSKYHFYNVFVDHVDETLGRCGAQRIAPIGKLDAATQSDEKWLSWKNGLLQNLAERFGSEENDAGKQWPMFDLVNLTNGWSTVSHIAEATNSSQQAMRVSQSRLLSGSPSAVQRTRQQQTRKYLHLELETKSNAQPLQYETGDHVAIWPINPNHEVALLANVFGWDKKSLKASVDIVPRNSGSDIVPVPTPTTREALLQYQLDICGPVTAELLELLVLYAPSAASKEYLVRCRSDISRQYLTCGELMKRAAPGATWNEDVFSGFLSLMPTLRPRHFSVASSPLVEPDTMAITVGLHEKATLQTDRLFVGLASGYLNSLHMRRTETDMINKSRHGYQFDGPRSILSGHKLFAHVRKSTFKLPANLDTPLLLIAAGSGIAPFRGFVQERMALARKGQNVGKMILLYGSRSMDDCLYQDLWLEASNMGILTAHFVLSSVLVKGKKFYVQHRLLELGEASRQLIQNENGSVYICGSTSMANDVKLNLSELLGGDDSISLLKESKRLQEDVWG